MKKFFMNKFNIEIIVSVIGILISLGISSLVVLALIKFIWG